jgi:hypothetical protein
MTLKTPGFWFSFWITKYPVAVLAIRSNTLVAVRERNSSPKFPVLPVSRSMLVKLDPIVRLASDGQTVPVGVVAVSE